MLRIAAMALLAVAPPAFAQSQTTPPSTTATPLVIGETFTIPSKTLGETRRINVYLPAPYQESPERSYPVLYMPDGGMGEDFLHVAGLVQVSVGNGTMQPMILVGIENTQRRRDLTGATRFESDRRIAPVVGGAAAFRAFLRDELLPEVERRYRTTRERAIIGESLAGLFVVETFFSEPALFDSYIALDPSLWWNGAELVERAAERLRGGAGGGKTLYLASSGEPELARMTAKLAARLERDAPKTLRWYYEPLPDESHGTIYHPAALRAVRRLFRPGSTQR
jgi:uncharacterized protein